MSNTTHLLAQRIEKAIDAEITRRLGTISNPTLRASIHELLHDSVNEKILQALSTTPPKTIDIATAVAHSMDELAGSVKALKGSALKSRFKVARNSDNGGKTSDSGAKAAPRSYSSGSKAGGSHDGWGGK